MTEIGLSVLALACSIAAIVMSLTVIMRATPQRVRKLANDAMQLAEESQNGLQVIANRTVAFMEEVTRERASAAGDLEEAERKRRQAAAKLSKVKASDEENQAPQSLKEVLDSLPIGDPRRLQVLRHAKTAAGESL